MTRWIGSYITRWLMRRPFILSAVTGIAQRIKPVWSTRKSTIALGYAEVNEVFRRGDCFELGPVGRSKMLSGDFLLGMDKWPVYISDKEAICNVLGDCEKHRLHDIVFRHSKEAVKRLQDRLAEARDTKHDKPVRIDLVTEVAEPVVTSIATELFLGLDELPPLESTLVAVRKQPGMDSNQQIFNQWLRKVGSVIVEDYPAPFGLRKIAATMALELNHFLYERCLSAFESRSKGVSPEPHGDVVSGLIGEFYTEARDEGLNATQLEEDVPERARRNLAGLLIAASSPLIHSVAVTIDQILKNKHRMNVALPAIDIDPHDLSFLSSAADDVATSPTASFAPDASCDSDLDDRAPGMAPSEMSPIDLARRYVEFAADVKPVDSHTTEGGRLLPDQWRARLRFRRTQLQMIDLVYEAMRFNTTFPFIARYSPREDVIGAPAGRVCPVAAGATVVASQLAAMHDSAVFPKPEVFAYRRRSTYMHFGAGDHVCLGKSIASKIIAHIVADLLAVPEVLGAEPGKMRFDGPAICGYQLWAGETEASAA